MKRSDLVPQPKGGPTVPRTILVHLNVQVPDNDTRPAEEIGEAIMAAYAVGDDETDIGDRSRPTYGLDVRVALAQEL